MTIFSIGVSTAALIGCLAGCAAVSRGGASIGADSVNTLAHRQGIDEIAHREQVVQQASDGSIDSISQILIGDLESLRDRWCIGEQVEAEFDTSSRQWIEGSVEKHFIVAGRACAKADIADFAGIDGDVDPHKIKRCLNHFDALVGGRFPGSTSFEDQALEEAVSHLDLSTIRFISFRKNGSIEMQFVEDKPRRLLGIRMEIPEAGPPSVHILNQGSPEDAP